MKSLFKVFAIFLLMAIFGNLQAQVTPGISKSSVSANFVSATYGNVLDTFGNSGSTRYLVYPVSQYVPNGYYKAGAIQLVATSISGTTTFTATIQHSNDGVNWYSLKGDSTYSGVSSGTYGWYTMSYIDNQIRIKVVSSASGSTQISGSYIFRREVITQQ